MWVGLDELHVLLGGGAQLGLRAYRHLGADGVLEVGVEPLVRVELGAVAGQVEHLDVGDVLGQPRLDGLAVMHAQVVQDEEDLLAQPVAVADERLKELDEPLVVEGSVDDHPVGPALVGDGGDHRQLLARAAHGPRHRPRGA